MHHFQLSHYKWNSISSTKYAFQWFSFFLFTKKEKLAYILQASAIENVCIVLTVAPAFIFQNLGYQATFITKIFSKKTMERSRLRNKCLHPKSDIDRKAYNKQCNYVVSILKKEENDFYGNLDISKVTNHRVIWKIVKPKISDKVKIHSKITLAEDDKILSQDAEIAKTFNEYFINIPILNMPNNQSFSTQTRSLEENTISGIIERYKDHPSINLIKSKNSCLSYTFSFTPV